MRTSPLGLPVTNSWELTYSRSFRCSGSRKYCKEADAPREERIDSLESFFPGVRPTKSDLPPPRLSYSSVQPLSAATKACVARSRLLAMLVHRSKKRLSLIWVAAVPRRDGYFGRIPSIRPPSSVRCSHLMTIIVLSYGKGFRKFDSL